MRNTRRIGTRIIPREADGGRSGHRLRPWALVMEDRTLLSDLGPIGLTTPAAVSMVSSPSRTTTRQTLSDLPVEAQYVISANIGRDSPAYAALAGGGGFRLSNPANRFDALLRADSLTLTSGAETWRMAVEGLGRGGATLPIAGGTARADANRVIYDYGTIAQWVVNGPAGLQQGFTVRQRPEIGDVRSPLTIELGLGGSLRAVANAKGDAVALERADGTTALTYGGLITYDATGRVVPSSLAVRPDGGHDDLVIEVQDAGAVYPLTVDPFVQAAKLTASDGATYDNFGGSVAISGDTVVAGSAYADVGPNKEQGAVYVFVKPAGGWASITQTAKLTATDGAAGDCLGYSVAISGDTIVAGAVEPLDLRPLDQGAAYVFVKPAGGWDSMTQTAKLTATDGAASDYFGRAVAISGDAIVVGAYANWNQGMAYVFVKPAGGWDSMTQTAKLTAADGTESDRLGTSVAISGDTIVAGASGAKVGTIGGGAAYVFVKPAGGWASMTQTAKLTASDRYKYDDLGASVAISGDTIVAGTPLAPVGGYEYAGAAYVFVKPAGGWASMTQTAKLTASDGAGQQERFGFSVAISGDAIVAGAPYANVGGDEHAGAAYMFVKPAGGWSSMTQTAKLTAADGTETNGLGWSVAISGDTVVVGTPYAKIGANWSQGMASVFVQQTDSRQPKVTVQPTSAVYGKPSKFSVIVSPASPGQSTPTGTVRFQVDGKNLGSAVTLTRGAATSIASAVLPAGKHTVTVVYSGDGNFTGITVSQTVTVAKAHLTVRANNKVRARGMANPPLTYTISGFVNADTKKVVSGKPVLSTRATRSSPPGSYPIVISLGTLRATNYDFPKLLNGRLTIRAR